MQERSPARRKLQEARERSAKRDERIVDLERANRYLQTLFVVSKVLTRFESVERTATEVIAAIAETLPISSAILIQQRLAAPRAFVWQAPSQDEGRLRAARVHATRAYNYLARSAVAIELEDHGDAILELPALRESAQAKGVAVKDHFVILPLVVKHGPIFGALQIEGEEPLDEQGLAFINAVVNQLAIALDRHAIIVARHAAAEAAEREQRLLAQVSETLMPTLTSRDAFSALARYAVPELADLCVIDEVGDDGAVKRLEVRFADEERQQELAPRVRQFAPQAGWQTPQARALATGKSLLIGKISDPLAEGLAHDAAHAEALRASGVESMLVVPLLARGKVLGVLTLCSAGSGRRYSLRDQALAEEIAHRAAIVIDNVALYERAQRATQARDNMLALVSHDLRNPLSVILMSLAVLPKPDGEDRRKSRKQLATIQRAAERMVGLVGDLLDTASIEANRLSLVPVRLPLSPLLSEAVDASQPLAAERGLRLEVDVPAELPAVLADAARLQQVLSNLLGNALKFTSRGGLVGVRAEVSGETVTVRVSDTGRGIAQEDLAHLFDRFWQARATAHMGTGLGLFISKAIVEAHGGELRVESTPGEGSTFSFTLPVSAPDTGSIG